MAEESKRKIEATRNVEDPGNRRETCIVVLNKSEKSKDRPDTTRDIEKLDSVEVTCIAISDKSEEGKGELDIERNIEEPSGGKKNCAATLDKFEKDKNRLGIVKSMKKAGSRQKICVAVLDKSREGKSSPNFTKNKENPNSSKRKTFIIALGKYEEKKSGLGVVKSVKESGNRGETYAVLSTKNSKVKVRFEDTWAIKVLGYGENIQLTISIKINNNKCRPTTLEEYSNRGRVYVDVSGKHQKSKNGFETS